ncbi:MAG: hypothetical protein H6983_18735 [Ectothiorhodospiraceae bacterium]|nr:hypothetical protein [Ectothiorhodospiraceae bacterium]
MPGTGRDSHRGTRAAARSSVHAHPRVVLPVRRWLQTEPYSCGAAVLKIVLDSLGMEREEEALMALAGTNPRTGTQPDGLRRALDALGVVHEVVEPGDIHLLEARISRLEYCIVDYQAWGRRGREFHDLRTGHYSVAFGFDPTHLLLADPAKKPLGPAPGWGVRTIRKDLFRSRWRDRGPGGLRTHRWMLCVPAHQHRPTTSLATPDAPG